MNISYTGKRPELKPDQQRKLEARWDKIAKLIEWKGQRAAHVVITNERHMIHVEATCNFYEHALVGAGSSPDYFTAAQQALDKLEKQAIKVRSKFRDTKRTPKSKAVAAVPEIEEEVEAPAANQPGKHVRIHHVDDHRRRKPMTLDEALIDIDERPYIVYRDTDKDTVSVLIRRADGHFDLVES